MTDESSGLMRARSSGDHSIGITPAILAIDPPITARGITANAAPARRHRFSRLEIADVVEHDPELIVTRLGLVDGDLILGVDYLLGMRLWLSFEGRRIFLAHTPP